MKNVWIAVLAVFFSCGGPGPKSEPLVVNSVENNDSNNDNVMTGNNTDNNNDGRCGEGQVLASVNGVEACFDECMSGTCDPGFECRSGICIGSVLLNNQANNEPNGTPNNEPNNVTECSTNAECRADQECKPQGCVDHITCFDGAIRDCYSTVFASWSFCDDAKEYRIECEDQQCECIVNDTVVSTFFADENECFEEAPHRVANRECDWLVP